MLNIYHSANILYKSPKLRERYRQKYNERKKKNIRLKDIFRKHKFKKLQEVTKC